MKRALFIFRRDLRLEDNKGLHAALKSAEEVIASFIFTPTQIENNPFRSDCCLQFMLESLEELEDAFLKQGGRLYLFYEEPEILVEKCIQTIGVDGVFVNKDYTPFSLERDQKIAAVCKKKGATFHSHADLLLHPVNDSLKSDGTPYTIFTPFYRHTEKLEVQKPEYNSQHGYYSKPISFSENASIYQKILPKRKNQQPGGRTAGLKILKNLKTFANYSVERDFPSDSKTTHLSPHLKFTTCSIREVYFAIKESLGSHHELIRSLYWRDFFTLIAFHFPHVFEGAFRKKFDLLPWKYDDAAFQAWCEGKTGFPIVDAGMRELNQTGFMHNRVRMITASFLVKDLHVDWRWGEKYFAQRLIDYDPAVNNGNWQWSASTGCDSQPYFRIFNPWAQAKKFDPDCLYIKKWIPELASFSSKIIHSWYLEKHHAFCETYPKPMVDHGVEAAETLEIYRKVAHR